MLNSFVSHRSEIPFFLKKCVFAFIYLLLPHMCMDGNVCAVSVCACAIVIVCIPEDKF